MGRNIEIKAHIESIQALLPQVVALADKGPIEVAQDDTFFACENGRLKLRAFSKDDGELIFYRRTNQMGPKESFYLRAPTSSPDALRDLLSQAYRQGKRIQKRRIFFYSGRTRIHLDDVKGLGHFLELEVVLEESEPAEAGIREANDIMMRLSIEPTQLIDAAYVDLLP
jgi:predicted adenylyl cyclase CyaB